MGTLWTEHTAPSDGRTRALQVLESSRAALALIEPTSPGESLGQPLALSIAPIYYRTKATYVFWMLRDMVGDAALSAALRAYSPAQDTALGLGPASGPGSFQKLLEQAGGRSDLSWFFADWVNADKGLPDLSIDSVFPTAAEAGNTLVAINVSNAGYASAEVPVTVRTIDKSVTQRVIIQGRGKAVVRLIVLGHPTEVQLNDGSVPETQASVHIYHMGAGAAPHAP
jgi:hypothetical protein